MKIELDNPIWSRLYGPYGVQDVTGPLGKLAEGWDSSVAADLFWERLHHQNDVYPVTYAALPWLWGMQPDARADRLDQLMFCAHVLRCAMSPAAATFMPSVKSRYRGLSLRATDHHFAWLPTAALLMEDDMPILATLEQWLAQNSPEIAHTCIAAIPADDDYAAAALVQAYAALQGCGAVAQAITMWGDRHRFDDIVASPEFIPDDARIARTIANAIGHRHAPLAVFLEDLSTEIPQDN